MNLDTIKDPKLRARIASALEDANKLRNEIKNNTELQGSQPESSIQDEPLAKDEREEEGAKRVIVRITSFRNRLCDVDNLCVKAIVDSLRYCGLIKDDRPEDIELLVSQRKCDKKSERTEIELTVPTISSPELSELQSRQQ